MEKYAKVISDLKFEFHSRFTDFISNENFFNLLFSIPFSFSVEDILENMHIEIIDFQINPILQKKKKMS